MVLDSFYVDLQYDEISLTFAAGSVCLCGVCNPVVVLGLRSIASHPVGPHSWFATKR